MVIERLPGVSVAAEVRPVRPSDMAVLVAMCDEHARHERAPYRCAGKAEALSQALFCATPRLHGWVADAAGELVGYATATLEFSTWQGGAFVHMDCLFVREGWRGHGIGAALLQAVGDFARRSGCLDPVADAGMERGCRPLLSPCWRGGKTEAPLFPGGGVKRHRSAR
jgi:GNAT superfamily N-acetyltransferase